MNNNIDEQRIVSEIIKTYNSKNKLTIKQQDLYRVLRILPKNTCLDFINIKEINSLSGCTIKPFMKFKWNTLHIKSFYRLFSYKNSYGEFEPYQYNLDWLYIQKGATIDEMFFNTKFNKKLPRMEENMSFNDFVYTTGLIVTPELLENNDMPIDTWYKNKHNQKLMRTNKQYEPMLEYWLNSDFITTEEKIEAMEESGIEIFEV